MADYLDLMLCLFPFEKELFEEAGLRTVWMGHPMVDQLEENRVDGGREKGLVGLFPGSREREVVRLFPLMVESARRLREKHPEWRFEAAAASGKLADIMGGLVREVGAPDDLVAIRTGTSQELMQRAEAGVVASGTATLEAAYYGLPYCLVYKVAWPTYFAARVLVELDSIGMVNILARRQVVHEFVQREANADNVTSFLESVMTDEVLRRELQAGLLEAAALLGEGGAADRAAEAIVNLLEE
jgi:lipid-A-disaccharide synthase